MLLKLIRKIRELFSRKRKSEPEFRLHTPYRIPEKEVYPIPKSRDFKPRSAYEKRVWKSTKKMPRKFKDEDED